MLVCMLPCNRGLCWGHWSSQLHKWPRGLRGESGKAYRLQSSLSGFHSLRLVDLILQSILLWFKEWHCCFWSVCLCVCMYIYVCDVDACIHVYMQTCTCVHISVYMLCACAYIHLCVCVSMYVYMHVCVHMCMKLRRVTKSLLLFSLSWERSALFFTSYHSFPFLTVLIVPFGEFPRFQRA